MDSAFGEVEFALEGSEDLVVDLVLVAEADEGIAFDLEYAEEGGAAGGLIDEAASASLLLSGHGVEAALVGFDELCVEGGLGAGF